MATRPQFAVRRGLFKLTSFARRLTSSAHAQAAVELAMIVPVILIVLLVGVQFAIIGEASLALGQANYQGARYASVYTSADQAAVQSYILSVASPTINADGGKYLTTVLQPAPPCLFGNTVTVSLTFDAGHLVALPNPFLGISFPTTLNSSESAFCE